MKKQLIILLFAFAALTPLAHGQLTPQLSVPNSPAYEAAANRLRNAPPRQYDFAKAVLPDVLRLMAADAGISFFGLPEGASGTERLVTFTISASPFSAMETLCKANGVSLIFENDIWYVRPADDTELVGRIYQIEYNAQELVRKNGQGSSTTTGGSGGTSGGGGIGGSGGSGASSVGLNLQGSPDYFVTEPSRLLEDVRAILDIPTTGRAATFAPTASVDTVNDLALSLLPGSPDVVVKTQGNGKDDSASAGEGRAKVIWNSDSNSLYVVATRQQHQWIEGYLAAADQPQPLVAVEVKFLETNKDPSRELGIDWTGTLAGGWGGSIHGDPTEGFPVDSVVNLDRIGDYALPSAILSADDVTLRLRALFDDRKTRTVSYPRMITLDNREVSFRSVINQPVLSSSASASLGAGATSTNSIEYIPIGTVINILPKRMSDGQVLLNISITVSDIVGTELINGNPFPIASSRVYSAPVTVESGYTVAINGLDSANSDQSETGVPVLGRIPILGLAFKSKQEFRHKQHLMMLITPTLLDTRGPGVPDRPTIRNPWDNQPMAESRPVAAAAMPASPATNSIAQAEVRTGVDAGAEDVDPLLLASAVPAEPKKRFRLFGKKDDKEAEGDNAEVTPVAVASAEKPATLVDAAEKAFSGNQQTTWTSVAEAGGNKPAESLKNEKPDATPAAPAAAATTVAAASPAPAPMPVKKAAAPASAPAAPAKGIDWKGDQLAGGAEAVPGAVAYLQQELEKATTSGGKDADKVFAQSDRLLRYINDLRDSGQVPVEGQLSDEWWSLLTVKTKAQGLKATATGGPQPALVNNVKPEDQ